MSSQWGSPPNAQPLLTEAEALSAGYAVDHNAAGRPIAYKGARFAPTEVRGLLTRLEERLLTGLGALLDSPEDEAVQAAAAGLYKEVRG